ncbi:MAG: SsrA-binding protein SmpB [Candidatus Paceibacterota bacterium]
MKKGKAFAQNKKASFDYQVIETLEAGIELKGYEVKAIKTGRANLAGAFVVFEEGNAVLKGMEIQAYQPKNTPEDYDPKRKRRLLLNKKEIQKVLLDKEGQGLTFIPISLYNNRNKVKVELALARRKKKQDKRESIKKREVKRRMDRYKR